jgi:hypothetical protein
MANAIGMMISRPKYSTITMIAARIAVATALSREISSSAVRALKGCLITHSLYAGETTDGSTPAFPVGTGVERAMAAFVPGYGTIFSRPS